MFGFFDTCSPILHMEDAMNLGLLVLGVLAWAGVVGLSILMATWDEPVLGFFPIAVAVVVAWAIGEYITDVVWKEKNR
jgi:hypothetical protein